MPTADFNEKALEKFDQDLKNNDVPIFYHKENELYYGPHKIALREMQILPKE